MQPTFRSYIVCSECIEHMQSHPSAEAMLAMLVFFLAPFARTTQPPHQMVLQNQVRVLLLAPPALKQPAQKNFPDRWQQPRLPRVFCASGHDRDIQRRADQRDLRLCQHDGQDPHRVRAEGDDRCLGPRYVRA